MMLVKRELHCDVLAAARARIAKTFDMAERVYVSFSGGKDSTCLLHLTMDEAIRRRRKIGVFFVDLEAQYRLTIEHVQACYDLYAEHIEPYWIALPLALRNAVSQFQPQWRCWDPAVRELWVRTPPDMAITDEQYFPFFRPGMEFEEFVPAFGAWYGQGKTIACLVGIRAQESLNRWRTIMSGEKGTYAGLSWTTLKGPRYFNAYPLYDWQTRDDWIYLGRTKLPYNRLYDRMYQAGLTIHQMRICQPYGDDQRKGLWLFHIIEPDTWTRVVARVQGANQGALYARERGNILGNIIIQKPEGHTWESYAMLLLDSMPPPMAEHYRNKIAVFLHWYAERSYDLGIPDDGPLDKSKPSWKRIVKALLRNDYWCKGLSFSQTKKPHINRYNDLMRRRRREWKLI